MGCFVGRMTGGDVITVGGGSTKVPGKDGTTVFGFTVKKPKTVGFTVLHVALA
jgi:hypothetical protein